MSIITNLTSTANNTEKYTASTSGSDESSKSTSKVSPSESTGTKSSLDSYSFSSQAISMADYIEDKNASDSSNLYGVLTYNQKGSLDLLYKKVSADKNDSSNDTIKPAETTAAAKTTSPSDYLLNNNASTDNSSLYNLLTYSQRASLDLLQKK